MRLTDAAVASLTLAADEIERIDWDDDLSGFGVRLRRGSAGAITKRWVVQYRPTPKRTRRMTLKGAPGVVRAAAARAWAREALAKVHLNDDPQAARIAARRAVTFLTRAEAYLDTLGPLRPATQTGYRRHLLNHAKPLHNRPVETITRSEIAGLISRIARENGAVQSNRVRATLSAFFAWCVMEHELPTNPVVGTRVQPETSRERVLSDQELAAIWQATEGMTTDHDRLVRLLMLTACRRNELGALRWSEIQGDVFVLPAARSKNHVAHSVPLHWLAIAQLPARVTGRDVVFGQGAHGFRGWAWSKRRLDKKLNFAASWTLHDLRRSCATWLASNDVEAAHIDAVLNHVDNVAKTGVRKIYNRADYAKPKRAALMLWGDHIAEITGQHAENIATLGRTGGALAWDPARQDVG
jgi:integrase